MLIVRVGCCPSFTDTLSQAELFTDCEHQNFVCTIIQCLQPYGLPIFELVSSYKLLYFLVYFRSGTQRAIRTARITKQP